MSYSDRCRKEKKANYIKIFINQQQNLIIGNFAHKTTFSSR